MATKLLDIILGVAASEIDQLMREILAYCKAHRGSQIELAKELKVTPQTLSNWLYSRKKPSLDKYLELLEFAKKKRIRRK
jgi:transcriptional regulator with XRE-family HTH domain